MFKQAVDVVVVYVTTPIQRVVGEFDVVGIIRAPILDLWDRTNEAGAIDEERFKGYFSGLTHGYAIEVGTVRQYEESICLEKRFGLKPPQSFVYLDSDWPVAPF